MHIVREKNSQKIGELSSKREAGRYWVGLWRIDWEEASLNSTDSPQNRCSSRDGVSAVVGMASGTSSGRRPRLHWDDG